MAEARPAAGGALWEEMVGGEQGGEPPAIPPLSRSPQALGSPAPVLVTPGPGQSLPCPGHPKPWLVPPLSWSLQVLVSPSLAQDLPPLPSGERSWLTSDQSRATHSGGHAGPWQASSTGGRGCGQALSSSAFSSAADTRRWHTTERLRTPASQLRLQRDQFPTTQLQGARGPERAERAGRPHSPSHPTTASTPGFLGPGHHPPVPYSRHCGPRDPHSAPTLPGHSSGQWGGHHPDPETPTLPPRCPDTPVDSGGPSPGPRDPHSARALTPAGRAPCCRPAASWAACCGRCSGAGPRPSCPAGCGIPRPAPGCLGEGRARSAPPTWPSHAHTE